jgi:HSP20 family protein
MNSIKELKMITRYYDGFRTPTFDLLDSFGFFGDLQTKTRSDSIDDEGIKIEMPGVKSSDLEVTVEGKTLKVSGKSRLGKEFSYAYTLKSLVDENSVTAHLQDGLLEIKLPKKLETKAKKIPIIT